MGQFLADRYPRPPDGATEVEREKMSYDDVKYARFVLTQRAIEAYQRADALNAWWRQKRREERAEAAG